MAFSTSTAVTPRLASLSGIEPDAHRIAPLAEDLDVADARQPLQLVDDLQIGVVATASTEIDGLVGRGQVDDQDEVRVLLLDRHAALIDDRRQRRGRLRHAVLHVDRGDVERVADLEGDGDRRRAVVRARRGHVGHALDAVDLLLERRRDRVGHDLRAGAGIVGADDDLRRRDLRKLRDRQQEKADRAGEHHDRGDRRGEDRALDEEADHQPDVTAARLCSRAIRRDRASLSPRSSLSKDVRPSTGRRRKEKALTADPRALI